MAPANASSGKSASETAAAEDWPDGRSDAARAGTGTGNGNDDHDGGCCCGGGEDSAQQTSMSGSDRRTGRHANACDDEDLDARNATISAGSSNGSAAGSSEGEEKKEEEEEMGAAATADAVTTSSTCNAGSDDGGPAKRSGDGKEGGTGVHDDIDDERGHNDEAEHGDINNEKQIAALCAGEDHDDSRKALAVDVDVALVRRAEEAEREAARRSASSGDADYAAQAHAADYHNAIDDGGDAAAEDTCINSRYGGSVTATCVTASSSVAVAMGMAASSAPRSAPVSSNDANTNTNTNDTARSRFPRGLGPGAYHVIPRRGGNGIGNDNPSDASARTDVADVAEVTRSGDASSGDIQLPVEHGFLALNGTSASSRRSSINTGTSAGSRQGSAISAITDPQQAQRRRTSLAASIESAPGAHAIPGINSGRDSFDGSASDQQLTAATETETGSGSGHTEIDITATAYLVEERDALEDLPSAEVVDPDEFKGPEPEPFHRRREGWVTMVVVGLLLLAVAVVLGVFSTNSSGGSQVAGTAGGVPTASPTQAPTFDPRPTLQVVQDRGTVRCGVENEAAGEIRFGKYTADLCRRLAAAVLGDPSRIRLVPVDDNNRYGRLSDREVDVMYAGDSFTLEKLVREPKTGSRIAFGGPYYGAAVVYAGNPTYVKCANNQKRHDECADLSICAVETPEISSLITKYFPASFVTFGAFPAMEASLRSGACNVIVSDTYRLSGSSLQDDIDSGTYIISDYHISRNLISSVVRLDDSEWYDIVEGTRMTSIRSGQIGIYQDISKCPANLSSPGIPGDNGVSFYNATKCVGNSQETFQRSLGELVLSFGSFLPAIDAPNFGSLECDDCANVLEWGKLRTINDRDCAVYLDPVHNLTRLSLATLVNVKFCTLLAVAIFQGNPDAVNITYIDEMDYSKFPREYDVVAGASSESKVGWDITNAGSMAFGMHYFAHDKYRHDGAVYDGVGIGLQHAFDNEDVPLIFLSAALITATVYAQRQGITRATSSNMPLIHLFGNGLTFMLQDVVAYGGNYDEILSDALASSDGATAVGWNTVIPNYFVSPKAPALFCDYTGNCPPCTWIEVDGNYVCYSVGPF